MQTEIPYQPFRNLVLSLLLYERREVTYINGSQGEAHVFGALPHVQCRVPLPCKLVGVAARLCLHWPNICAPVLKSSTSRNGAFPAAGQRAPAVVL